MRLCGRQTYYVKRGLKETISALPEEKSRLYLPFLDIER